MRDHTKAPIPICKDRTAPALALVVVAVGAFALAAIGLWLTIIGPAEAIFAVSVWLLT
jgi:hypothetical protein